MVQFPILINRGFQQSTFLCKQALHLSKMSTSEAPLRAKNAPRIAKNRNRRLFYFPSGTILTDSNSRKWKLEKSIGFGGFGEIYLASGDIKVKPGPGANFAIKVGPYDNGALFVETHCYYEFGIPKHIRKWKKMKKLRFLGVPKLFGSGVHKHNDKEYQFLIMERFGEDLQTLLDKNNNVFPIKTVYTLGKLLLDILEYIHSHGYVHEDVKAANLLMGYGPGKENEVYLIDFGIADHYVFDGQHEELEEKRGSAHSGTITFTSRDAHMGAPFSRRADLEILGYNMLQWLCGRLPWEDNLKDKKSVDRQKSMYLSDISTLMKSCFQKQVPPSGIAEYFSYVAGLAFEEEPDYGLCKNILSTAIKAHGFKDDGILVYTST